MSSQKVKLTQPVNLKDFKYIYLVISQRSKGLSIGLNLNPDRSCNFECVYCYVDKGEKREKSPPINVKTVRKELREILSRINYNQLRTMPEFAHIPDELMQLRTVALSGEGEPTLCPNFLEVIQTVLDVRQDQSMPAFKVALISNSTGFDRPGVLEGIEKLAPQDEVWAKLDAGSIECFERINSSSMPLERVLENILLVARRRGVVIQSLFPMINGREPGREEIDAYVGRLGDLLERGAHIDLVQVYSTSCLARKDLVQHLSLKELSRIAEQVRAQTGLRVEVF